MVLFSSNTLFNASGNTKGGGQATRRARRTDSNGKGVRFELKGNAAKARGGRGAKHRSPGKKHCSKCAESGGAHWSHNTVDCTRHKNADAPTNSGGGDRVSKSAFVQYKKKYDNKFKRMTKQLKKLKKSKKKSSDNGSSSDSDSS